MSSGHNIPQVELLKRLKKGDSTAFEEIFNTYKGRAYAFVLKFVKTEDFAADIIHDVFLKIWEGRKRIDCSKNFESYFFTICKNTVFNFLKKVAHKESVKNSILNYITTYQQSFESELYYKEYELMAKRAIDMLPPRRREVFRLCKLDGKSYAETASDLGISRNAVKEHIVKASSFIREYFRQRAEISI